MCLFTIDFSSSLSVATFAFLKYELAQEAVSSVSEWTDFVFVMLH